MLFQSRTLVRTLVRCLAVSALTAAVLALAIDQCDARRAAGAVVAVALAAALT